VISLHVILAGDGAWPDLIGKKEEGKLQWFRSVPNEPTVQLAIAGLEAGMVSGAPSVALRIDLPDENVVVIETSMKSLILAAKMFEARYGLEGT